jgi:hypothetical protein
MSDEENTETTPPVEEVKKVTLARKAKLQAAENEKVYVSTGKHTYPFEIQIHGEVLSGQWSKDDGRVQFVVPDRLVEGFEKHFHFTAGNLVAA